MRDTRFLRRVLGMVLVAAAVVHVSGLLLVGLLLLPVGSSGRSFILWPLAVVAFLLSLGVVAWGAALMVRIPAALAVRATSPAPASEPSPASSPVPPAPSEPEEGHSTVINPRRQPAASPTTPSHPVAPQASWSKATTPWPRANEADPAGTLIRPPNH